MVMLGLMMLLIWAGDISLNCLWMLGRALLNARAHWYPIMLQLHRFMIAISRVAVNHDWRGGSAPDPLVWDQESKRKQREADIRVHDDVASLPGPPGFF